MDNLIELAQNHIEKDRPTKAFFCLALEAIAQLTRLADAQLRVAERLDDWAEGGTLSITTHKPLY